MRMKRINMLDDKTADYKGKSYADFLAERAGVEKKNLKKDLELKLGIS